MKGSEKNRKYTVLALYMAILPVSFAFPLLSGAAESNKGVQPDKARTTNINDFTYTSQRRDPFERAVAFKAKNQPPGTDLVKAGYELEELKLVGVMKAGTEKFAVMEDMQGKGLLFKKGQNLNSTLWVSDILEEKIILGHRLKGDTRLITLNIPRK